MKRPSDEILEGFNRIYEAKKTGVLRRNEFPNLVISIGDLYANKIKQGKVDDDERETFISFATSTGMEYVSKSILESISVASITNPFKEKELKRVA